MLSTISRQEFDNFQKNGFNRIPLVLECFADLDTPLSVYSKLANVSTTQYSSTIMCFNNLMNDQIYRGS